MHAIVVRPSCRATRGRRRPGGPVVRTIAPLLAVALPALAVLPSLGCAGDLRRRTVEASTRDWFATLRAAQVLPVYPLTEDLEPGDVFLVTVPIQRQQELYARDGYLPLDLLGPRLDVPSPGYDAFYDDRFWAGRVEGGPPPRPATADDPVRAPRVVFPRLAVEVASDAGLSIGLPLQAVPVGLGLLRAERAAVTVDLSDAYTYGLPGDALLGELRAWARRPEVRDLLGEMATASPEPIYLRCVSRVYLARRVTVGISSGRDGGQSLVAGLVPPPPGDPDAVDGTAAALERAVAGAAAGGSLRLRQAVGSTLILDEDLGTPMVFGYLGFDVPVRPSGDLGPPVATLAAVQEQLPAPRALTVDERTVEERLLRLALLDLEAATRAEPERAAALTAAVARGLGDPAVTAAADRVAAAGDDPAAVERAVDGFARAIRRFAAEDRGEQARERRAARLVEAALTGSIDLGSG